jgi:hypothetical protein
MARKFQNQKKFEKFLNWQEISKISKKLAINFKNGKKFKKIFQKFARIFKMTRIFFLKWQENSKI